MLYLADQLQGMAMFHHEPVLHPGLRLANGVAGYVGGGGKGTARRVLYACRLLYGDVHRVCPLAVYELIDLRALPRSHTVDSCCGCPMQLL